VTTTATTAKKSTSSARKPQSPAKRERGTNKSERANTRSSSPDEITLAGDTADDWRNYKTMCTALVMLAELREKQKDEAIKNWEATWNSLESADAELVAWSLTLVGHQLLTNAGGDYRAILRELGTLWLLPRELWKAPATPIASAGTKATGTGS
jgi:hypothetical protein